MIAAIIKYSMQNRFLVLLATACLAAWGIYAAKHIAIDALPDLSDVQVVLRVSYPGQSPQIMENQITYPLSTTMLAVPGAKTVRSYSYFGDAFVYVIFEDGTDLYWARSRVLEAMSNIQGKLPAQAKVALGPDATGVGWVFQYALIDKSGKHSLADLRSMQDWFIKYELQALPNISEVAPIGGMVKQFQIVLDPQKMTRFGITPMQVAKAVGRANQESGGSALEMGEAEYMVRSSGYLKNFEGFRAIPLAMNKAQGTTPITLGDVADIRFGPEMRRGIAELDGESEVVGGVVIARIGADANSVIEAVKEKLATIQKGLPPGVELVVTYDRSKIINRAVENLTHKLLEEFLVVSLVCLAFLWHLRSSMVAILTLPLAVLMAIAFMQTQGVNANIMSLGGIAIAIGAMVDAAVVMIENAFKKLEHFNHQEKRPPTNAERWQLIADGAIEVGPALFFSLAIITVSFLPVFTLQAQEGRLFAPLAFTKTFAMGSAALLSITLVPVLMGYWIVGKIPDEQKNPLNRFFIAIYKPLFVQAMRHPKTTLTLALLLMVTAVFPIAKLGGEFLPPLDEGDVLYMPSALPGLSAGKAGELLQLTDRLIKTVPEVHSVFGKAGRADSATDPAPLEMFETTVRFKPKAEWRANMTPEKLIAELDQAVKVPGLANIWVPPIRNRIDMLATGIKSPIGVKVAGSDLALIDQVAAQIEAVAKKTEGVSSALAERLTGGRYINVEVDRFAASRYGMNVADVQDYISTAIGGKNIGEVVDKLSRYPINIRYPRELRDSLVSLRNLPMISPTGAQITLEMVAKVDVEDGPSMIKSENARLSGWVFVDVRGADLASVVHSLRDNIAKEINLPAGVSISFSGQYEFLERANQRLKIVIPATLMIIFVLLYLTFNRVDEAVVLMLTLPFATVGGLWLLWLMGYNQSIATGVGFIALAGLAAEFGVVMLMYLRQAREEQMAKLGRALTVEELQAAIFDGAVKRVRPKAMTVATILGGLLPIMFTHGTGSEMMQRIAAPMIGGMITAPLLSMFIIPVIYFLMRKNSGSIHHSTG